MENPQVSIIILNWNGWKDTVECLESLYQIAYPNYDVIVVDNGSRDGSVQKIKKYCEGKIRVKSKFFEYNPNNKPIKVFEISDDEARQGKFNRSLYRKYDANRRLILIKNKDNYGFAGGNNVGIKFALSILDPDYILLLNNDTVVDKRFLNELVKVAENDKRIGIVGPKIYYYSYDGRNNVLWFAGGYIDWKYDGAHFRYKKVDKNDNSCKQTMKMVEFISGCAMLIRKDVLSRVKLLDYSLFAYHEDVDFCIRVNKAGYVCMYAPCSYIWHKVGKTVKKNSKNTLRRYLHTRNKLIIVRKNYGILQYIDAILKELFILTPIYIMIYIYKKQLNLVLAQIKAIFDAVKFEE